MVMVLGFVGTVIALERAVALRRAAGFAAPALLGVGGLLVTSAAPLRLGQAVAHRRSGRARLCLHPPLAPTT